MDESVFDVLDELEYETNARYNIDPSILQPQKIYSDSELLPGQPTNDLQEYDGNKWPREWGDELNEEFSLDEFDQRVLNEPARERQHEAAEGRARLSLPVKKISELRHSHQAQEYQQLNDNHINEALFPFTPDRNFQLTSSSPPFTLSPPFGVGRTNTINKPSHLTVRSPPVYAGSKRRQPEFFEKGSQAQRVISRPPVQPSSASYTLPTVQGIQLVPIQQLPDRTRSIFSFPLFNAVQSKCFQTIYNTDNNFVLSAPTGSGKTVVLELAICRLVSQLKDRDFKIIYQAPTKALCAEKFQDWQKKFSALDLQCAQLTGDTEHYQLKGIQSASVIITTPEKWDSMTRKWKDHQKLMNLIKLFLIDEVHILKDERGATLEAVVSRMKSVGSNVRFIALSATVPNCADIADWLGKNYSEQDLPADMEVFGETFRPVKLQKFVCGFPAGSLNDFGFDKLLDSKLYEVIAKYSKKRPIMVFCSTRSIAATTAKNLAKWWSSKQLHQAFWNSPSRRIGVLNNDLKECVLSGVAFHHGGLELNDRHAVESGFLAGDISVICCTSTLAIGVNLPCHFVIIKNTVSYQAGMMKEYADLEIMQMLGRAGRPQFDRDALAVIMTRQEKSSRYEKMVSGQETIESCLHLNLIEHLNAEIDLEAIKDHQSAKRWLMGTFLHVRAKRNPEKYGLTDALKQGAIEDSLYNICAKDIALLKEWDLITKEAEFKSTEFGDAMARYYIRFETMKKFLSLKRASKLSDILSTLSQASEFQELRFRAGEKGVYKKLNASPCIRFPILVNLDLPAQKVSLIIQSVLGSAEFPAETKDMKHRSQYNLESAIIFQHVSRLIRCIIDIFLFSEDGIASRNALMLARSLGAKAWDDSPLHLKQLDQIGIVAVRRLANAGILTMENLEDTEPYRIEMLLARNPPFGSKLLDKLKAFPKVYVSQRPVGKTTVSENGVMFSFRAEFGFLNDKVPFEFGRAPIYICLLSEISDGRKAHFCRISARKLKNGQEIVISALLTTHGQSVTTYIMCDEIAGTLRQATITPNVAKSLFRNIKPYEHVIPERNKAITADTGTSGHKTAGSQIVQGVKLKNGDNHEERQRKDSDLSPSASGSAGYVDIDTYNAVDIPERSLLSNDLASPIRLAENNQWQPTQLANGKWLCNHKCKNKSLCKHLCCHEGLDQPPKRPKTATSQKVIERQQTNVSIRESMQNHENVAIWPSQLTNDDAVTIGDGIEEVDLTKEHSDLIIA